MQTPFALPAQTSFESERSQHRFQSASAQDGLDSEFSDDDPSDPDQDVTPRRSSRKRNATQASRDGDDQVSHECIPAQTFNSSVCRLVMRKLDDLTIVACLK